MHHAWAPCTTCRTTPWLATRRQPRRAPAALASNGSRAVNYDVLVLDATNVLALGQPRTSLRSAFADWLAFLQLLTGPTLTVACFDMPKGQRGSGLGQRQALEQGYLRRRRRQREAGGSGAGSGRPGGGLHPFLQHLREQQAVGIVAQGGWEADDCMGAVCALLEGACPELAVVVASGDSDMQQLLSPRVSWLHLAQAPSLQHPLGLELVTAEAFERQHGFPPAAYPEWLAFVGKRDASIGGAGTGATTAAKLLRRYGSIAGIEAAAERGELAGWSAAAQRLFGGAGNEGAALRQRLHRSRRLFTINRSPEVLGEQACQDILSRAAAAAAARGRAGAPAAAGGPAAAGSATAGRAQSSSSSAGCEPPSTAASSADSAVAELAWQHPLHASRWRHNHQHVGRLAAELQRQGAVVEPRAVTRAGLPVDLLVQTGRAALGGSGDGPVAVLLAAPCDFQQAGRAGFEELATAAAAVGVWPDLAGAAGQSGALARRLTGAVQQHVRLLRKEGLEVVCVPWWLVPPLDAA